MDDIKDRRSSRTSRDALRAKQWRKLEIILRHAYDRVPFYRERFRSIGAEPEDIRTPGDLRRFPVLTRQDILDHVEEMLAYPKESLRRGHSGGSTGYPLVIYHTREYERLRRRQKIMLDGWIGAKWLWPAFELWGITLPSNVPTRLTRRHLLFKPHYRYSIRQVNEEVLKRIAGDFLAVMPLKVFGYASLLRSFALYLLEHGLEARRKARAVISSSETLTPEDRRLMEQSYGGTVYNRYNSRENAAIASECRERTGLHVHTDHLYLEVVENNLPVPAGEPGHVILTDLDSLAMPYIRYRNEDIASWSGKECPCGRPLPLLEAVYGRETDFLFGDDGSFIPAITLPGPIRNNFGSRRVRHFQFRQKVKGQVELLVVPGVDWQTEDESKLIRVLSEFFTGCIRVDVQLVKEIPTEPSGKTRVVKSEIAFS